LPYFVSRKHWGSLKMRLVNILLWSAFGLLLAASGVVLLYACDLNHPHFLSTAQRFCPVPVDTSARDRAVAKRDALQARIHDAELKIARIASCVPAPTAAPSASPVPPRPAQQPAPQPSASPQPSSSPQPAPAPRAQNNDPGPTVGRRGKLEITLWWNTTDDLDLTVLCPGGVLSPRASEHGPGVCGDGVHDVDANQKMINPVSDPKEHVTWDSPPDGDYTVQVKAYKTNHPEPIDYSVRIQLDDEVRICQGTVQWNGATGYYESPIIFKPRHPLPECHRESFPETVCTGAGCK
jgi:hypothetical protein